MSPGYDRAVVEHHDALLAHTHRTGNRRGVHDLIIAVTAHPTGRPVATTDERARFGELPDATVRFITV